MKLIFPLTSLRKASFALYVLVKLLTVSEFAMGVTMLAVERQSLLIHKASGIAPSARRKPTYSALVDEVTV